MSEAVSGTDLNAGTSAETEPTPIDKIDAVTPEGGAATADTKTPDTEIKGDFPDDWRNKIAGDDEKALKQLSRLGSPKDLAKAYFEAQKKLSSGNLIEKLPEKPTDEQLADYRKKNGIPETHEGYDLNELPNGLVIPEHERVFLDKFVKGMHEVNATPTVVKQALAKYADVLNDMAETAREIDATNRIEAEANLKNEWGGHYTRNNNIINNMLNAQFGTDTGKQLQDARLPGGKRLFDDPAVKATFLRMALEIDPEPSLENGAGGGGQSIDARIKELTTMSRTNRNEYKKYVQEHIELNALKIRMDKKK